ncbi:MAG: hypothetical protein AAGJ87_16320, partial [Pseudomonadota bacterium]
MRRFVDRLSPAIRQTALYGSAIAGAKLVSLAMAPVFTHFLHPADYGRLDILQAFADVLSILIGFVSAITASLSASSEAAPAKRNSVSARPK